MATTILHNPFLADNENDSDASYVFLSSLDEAESVDDSDERSNPSSADDETIGELIQKQKRKLDAEREESNNNKNKIRKTNSPVKQQIMKRKHDGSNSSSSTEDDGNTADSESGDEETPDGSPIIRGLNFLTGDWHCTKCGDSMGCNNPRQLCGKWCCLNMKTA